MGSIDGRETNTLEYVESMLGQLHILTATLDQPTLAYLIEMARIEAHDRLVEASGVERDHAARVAS
jgi:hypothetical protein